MWIPLEHPSGVGDTDPVQRLQRPLPRVAQAQHRERLLHLRADLDGRIQRGAGILVDHRDAPCPQLLQLAGREMGDVRAADQRPAGRDAAVPGQVAQGRIRRRRLAAARLPDQAVGLAGSDRERDAPKHGPLDPANGVGHLEVLDGQRRPVRGLRQGAHSCTTDWSASAIRLAAITRLAMASEGKNTVHQ